MMAGHPPAKRRSCTACHAMLLSTVSWKVAVPVSACPAAPGGSWRIGRSRRPTAGPSAHASLSHFMKRLRVRTDPLLPAVRTTYRGSVDRDLVVLVILSPVWAMVQFIIVMVATLALVHLLWG
jgi:hypothetical protein